MHFPRHVNVEILAPRSHQPSPQCMHYLSTLSPPSWEQNPGGGLTFGPMQQTLTKG